VVLEPCCLNRWIPKILYANDRVFRFLLQLIVCSWISAHLVADAAGYSGIPLQMYEPQDLYVKTGDEARLFCEGFVGKYCALTGNPLPWISSLHVIIWRIQILLVLYPRPVLTDSLGSEFSFVPIHNYHNYKTIHTVHSGDAFRFYST
jgi:hypothetical protein